MKRVFSGIQPTGELHLGNYITMRRFLEQQNDKECFYCVVDLHSITMPHDPAILKENTLSLAAFYLAVGLDPKKVTLFLQSQVPAHAELSWLLECTTYMGELSRMTQFKDKSAREKSIPTGLLTYPVLMAADILLYDTDYVPVGNDQKQHLELARNLAERFNGRYGETFIVPEPLIQTVGARIMSLDDPLKKMSKSQKNIHSKISMLDTPSKIKKSIMKATTDSEACVRFDEKNKPGVSNLMTIYSQLGGVSLEDIESKYAGVGYGQFKKDLVDVVTESLYPIQKKHGEILQSGTLETILKEGAQRARNISQSRLEKAKKNMGFLTF